jgi:Flp pilus assembly protein TadG
LLTGFALESASSASSSWRNQVASAPLVNKVAEMTSDSKKATVIVTPLVTEEVDFSHEVIRLATFADVSEGVLLLPQSASGTVEARAQEMFSDEVRIMNDETGQQFVARLGAHGEDIERIPFVIVPVTKEDTP